VAADNPSLTGLASIFGDQGLLENWALCDFLFKILFLNFFLSKILKKKS